MKNLDFLTDGIAVVFTMVQANELFQLISLILTSISILIGIIYRIIIWYKNASKDGKIDLNEIEDLKNIIDDENNKLKGE